MTANKYLIDDKVTLLKNKLARLSKKLEQSLASGEFQTQEHFINEAVSILTTFFKTLNEPVFEATAFNADDLPDPDMYNKLWNTLLDDLIVLFLELENLETLTLANFNFITTEANRLTSRLKRVSSLIGDYILYSNNPTKDSFFFKDSFNDLSRIDFNSPLLNKAECEINQEEGIVTLPINKEKNSIIVVKAAPVINPDSNGSVGNSHQIGARFNGDMKVVLDNNPDTWFEYEKVVNKDSDDKEPLILDVTINLGEERVINHIRLNPNNFGTKTVIIVEEIETSLDGEFYTSIKDDIPISGFETQDEENVFVLAPSTSKFAGQGLYTFIPRKVKYIHLILKQTEPYVIQTTTGEKLRYAIGLRDIDIRGYTYLSEGEFISKPFVLNNEIRKVLLDTNQNPIETSEIAGIQYFLSPDDGQSWHEIQPKEFDAFANEESTVPEVMNFNGPEEKSVNTPVPVKSVRLKARLFRNDDNFAEGTSTLRKKTISTAELHPIPTEAPFTVELEQFPVLGSITVIDPMFGSRGVKESAAIIGQANMNSASKQRFYIPIRNIPRPWKKVPDVSVPPVYSTEAKAASEYLHITVGGIDWLHGNKDITTYTANYATDPEWRLYTLDHRTGELKFGTGKDAMPPPDGSPIGFYMDAEQLFPSEILDKHSAKLDFPTSIDKTGMKIRRYSAVDSNTQIVPRRATVIHLEKQNIVSTSDIGTTLQSRMSMDASPKTFINGKDELTTATSWSVDKEAGIIYLAAPTLSNEDISLTYTFQDVTDLKDTDWEWGDTDTLKDSVVIKESGWKTNDQEELSLPTTGNRTVLDLAHLAVVRDTLEFNLEDGAGDPVDAALNPFNKEIPFIDGKRELGTPVIRTLELVPTLTPGVDNIAVFNLRENVSTTTAPHTVHFSNSVIFKVQDQNLNDVGDWYIDRDSNSPTYGRVSVKLPSNVAILNPGRITYFYVNPNYIDGGLYSVDYKLGKVYMQRALQSSWVLTATYQYTDIRAEYKIARLVKPKDYDVDIVNRTIVFKSEEILDQNNVQRETGPNQGLYYLINYDYISEAREDIEALKDLFSPIIKDYTLRVVTKNQLI